MYVGLHGSMCSGKDTAADFLVEEYGFVKINFGDELKHWTFEMLTRLAPETYPDPWHRKDDKMRAFLQGFATTARAYDPDIWVRAAFATAASHQHVVFADVRLPNEVRWIQERGGDVLRLQCDESERQARIQRLYPDTDPSRHRHVSEQPLPGHFATLPTTTMDQMQAGLRWYMQMVRGSEVEQHA